MKPTLTVTFVTISLAWLVLSMIILDGVLKVVGLCVFATFLIYAIAKRNEKVE
jgi:hypothetical protein